MKKRSYSGVRRDIAERTGEYALRVIRLYSALPKTAVGQVIGRQMLRCGTSVGAHIREGKRSRSDAEMISKTEGALQELEETGYWLELLAKSEIVKPQLLEELIAETDELISILVTGVKTIKKRKE